MYACTVGMLSVTIRPRFGVNPAHLFACLFEIPSIVVVSRWLLLPKVTSSRKGDVSEAELYGCSYMVSVVWLDPSWTNKTLKLGTLSGH